MSLVGEGEEVFATSPNLTSQYRTRGNQMKSDEVDAANAARDLLTNPTLGPFRFCIARELYGKLKRLKVPLTTTWRFLS